ncbi:MAG: type III-B CRISPR module-associated protein Cmr5 [Candidatus Aminicenantes bacterium]|nr:type III-B CRISPR module-associated protein Cmr5 [Candidatus Aminicenantes bacterium]
MKGREDLIVPAIKAIEKQEIAKNGKVPNEFKGYIDTFAAGIVQNGLIPAVIFFESGSKNTSKLQPESASPDKEKESIQKNRNKMMQAILSLAKRNKDKQDPGKRSTLLDYILSQPGYQEEINNIRRDIVEAAVAFKLALRTFEFEK